VIAASIHQAGAKTATPPVRDRWRGKHFSKSGTQGPGIYVWAPGHFHRASPKWLCRKEMLVFPKRAKKRSHRTTRNVVDYPTNG